MKTLSFKEAKKYLSQNEIEEILTNALKHKVTERDIFGLSGDKDSELEPMKHIGTYDDGFSGAFSNRNWKYYRDIFKKLLPESLSIASGALTDISGIEDISTLKEVFLGDDDWENCCHVLEKEEVFNMLKLLFKLPKIRQISFGRAALPRGGYEGFAKECCEYMESIVSPGYEVIIDDSEGQRSNTLTFLIVPVKDSVS